MSYSLHRVSFNQMTRCCSGSTVTPSSAPAVTKGKDKVEEVEGEEDEDDEEEDEEMDEEDDDDVSHAQVPELPSPD